MRLIDADRLKEMMATTLEVLKHIFPPGEHEVHLISAFATVGEMVDDCHTIDAVPVKHGEWIEHGEPNEHGKYELWYYSCSVCHHVGGGTDRYCAFCGAKMDGGKDDESHPFADDVMMGEWKDDE